MKAFLCFSALLSFDAAGAFQVPKAWPGKKSPNLPDDGMQDMAGEMAKLDTNYDYSYNVSPTTRSYRQLSDAAPQEQQAWLALAPGGGDDPEIPTVVPWSKDDLLRDAAVEWDALGTNYDYSYNNSPSEIRCKETERRQALLVKQRQEEQAAAARQAALMVQPKRGDHWEQWMSLSRPSDRGETALAWPSREEMMLAQRAEANGGYAPDGELAPSEPPKLPAAGPAQSYLGSL